MMLILIKQESCIMGYGLIVERCAPTTATTTTVTGTTTERVLIIVVVLLLLELKNITRILHASKLEDSIQNLILFEASI